jgi:hypothetical protein
MADFKRREYSLIDRSLLETLIRRVHFFIGTKSGYGFVGDLDIASALNNSNLQIDNTESYFNLLNQRRLSNLNFASFDKDPSRKRKFLYEALNLAEEEISLAENDPSFSRIKLQILYFNFLKIMSLVADTLPIDQKKELLVNAIYLIDSLESNLYFLNSWFDILKVRFLYELGYHKDALNLISEAKEKYLQNFSEHFFEVQTEYGQTYWTDEIKHLESLLTKK